MSKKKMGPRAKEKAKARALSEVKAEVLEPKKLRVVHEESVEDGDDFLYSDDPETLSAGGNDVIVHGRFGDNSHQDYGGAEVIGHSISAVHHR